MGKEQALNMSAEETKEEEFTLSFESVSALVVKYLSPVEELSPFKLGNIQKLISDSLRPLATMSLAVRSLRTSLLARLSSCCCSWPTSSSASWRWPSTPRPWMP